MGNAIRFSFCSFHLMINSYARTVCFLFLAVHWLSFKRFMSLVLLKSNGGSAPIHVTKGRFRWENSFARSWHRHQKEVSGQHISNTFEYSRGPQTQCRIRVAHHWMTQNASNKTLDSTETQRDKEAGGPQKQSRPRQFTVHFCAELMFHVPWWGSSSMATPCSKGKDPLLCCYYTECIFFLILCTVEPLLILESG